MNYDVIIVGSGPAGIFAAKELADQGKKVLIIEKGKSIKLRNPNDIMYGFGGTGTFSDGKLHFTPVLSHTKMLDLYSEEEYQKILNQVDKTYSEFGVDSCYYPKDIDKVNQLVEECKKNGIQLYVRKTRHVGSDKLPEVIRKMNDYLISKNIEIKTDVEVLDLFIEDKIKGVKTDKGDFFSENVILCPGRSGTRWLQLLAEKYNFGFDYEKIEVGVRVEFPEEIMRRFSEQMYETVFSLRTPTFDDIIRTFCPCPNGKVAIETYDDNGTSFVCVNGHSTSKHDSKNSNFALVTEIKLTEPLENTVLYGKSIGMLANTIGGGKPIIQRYADLKSGRRSTWKRIEKSYVNASLKDVIPGDISMAVP